MEQSQVPTPHQGESKEDFVARAIKYLKDKEGLPQKQAVGKAHGLLEYGQKNRVSDDKHKLRAKTRRNRKRNNR